MSLNSFLYTGNLHHRRVAPKVHDFSYQVAMFYLDLSEIEKIFSVPIFFTHHFPRLSGFRRKDYLKGDPSLIRSVQKLIQEKTGKLQDGPIRLLTQIRYFGFCFNPVSFYYCFDRDEKLRFIVSEITNTPWNERHAYVHEVNPDDPKNRYQFKKDFHVSPFLPMDLEYRWEFNAPVPAVTSASLRVDMEDWDLKTNERVFEAHLRLTPKPLNFFSVAGLLVSFPLLTFKTFIAIYYQALRLKLKGAYFYSHPQSGEKS